MIDLTLPLTTGVDIPIPECRLVLHQPKIKEISHQGELEFFSGIQCLCIKKPVDRPDLKDYSEFQIFMTIMNDKEARDRRKEVMNTLFLLFPNYKISVTPRALLFNLEKENIIIDENNFLSLQEVLRQVGCLNGKNDNSFNPANEAAAEIARKLERGRRKVAALKGDNNGSVLSQYLSILCVGLHIPLTELINLTIFQLYDLVERYTLWINWDLDIRSRLAGGSPDGQPDNWMKVIH